MRDHLSRRDFVRAGAAGPAAVLYAGHADGYNGAE
jgi:hypothetical protein